MEVKPYYSQVTVFLLIPDLDKGTNVRQFVSKMGFDTYVFADKDTLLSRIKEMPPHVVVFAVHAVAGSLKDFVQSILKLNSEVKMIALGKSEQLPMLSEYFDYGMYDFIGDDSNLEKALLWSLARLTQSLIVQNQNESLIDKQAGHDKLVQEAESKNKDLGLQINELHNQLTALQQRPVQGPLIGNLLNLMIQLSSAKSKEELVQVFIAEFSRQFGQRLSILYFKFLPTVYSLVATQAANMSLDQIKGVGFKLDAGEVKNYRMSLSQPNGCASVQRLMKEAFGIEQFRVQSLPLLNDIDGIFIFFGQELGLLTEEEYKLYFMILRDFFERYHLRKKVFDLEIKDDLTQLHNDQVFKEKIDEELSRARRIQSPLSLVLMSLDRFEELKEHLGESTVQIIIKSIAAVIKKTSRVNDITCRLSENEIAFILPHCARKGGAIRAERLRRIIESTAFALEPVKVTASFGVSEYPSLSHNSEDLIKTARHALQQISLKSGNKVCLASVATGFRPDFDVPPV